MCTFIVNFELQAWNNGDTFKLLGYELPLRKIVLNKRSDKMENSKIDFVSVTELANEKVSKEQIERMCHRYYWAGEYCKNKDVVEVACGAGLGLGYIKSMSKSIVGGDISNDILDIAKSHYGERINLLQFGADELPYDDSSKDVIILFEAIYYLPDVEKFVDECSRVLRKNGSILIATANKDLYDFNPSPHSHRYFGTVELFKLFHNKGYTCELFACFPVSDISWRQKILRPIKKLVVSLGIMPKSMRGKKLLKRLVFGDLVPMPSEITENMYPYEAPIRLSVDNAEADTKHKVLYCAAVKNND